MTHPRIATLLLLAATVGARHETVATQAPQQDMIGHTLQSGSLKERTAAAREVIALDHEASSSLASALAAELLRMNAVVANRSSPERSANADEWSDAAVGEYYGDLIEAAASLGANPVVLQPLIGALETGQMAVIAVARFGMQASSGVLSLLADQTKSETSRAGATNVIKAWLGGDQLDAVALQDVIALLRVIVGREEPYSVLGGAIDAAVMTGDLELRKFVTDVSANPALLRLDGGDPRSRRYLQDRAKRAISGRRRLQLDH